MLQEQNAVGDVCVIPYNANGDLLENALMPRLIGVSADQISRARYRIAVATGVGKTAAVVGALRSGLVTTLFIDEKLAQSVLNMLRQQLMPS